MAFCDLVVSRIVSRGGVQWRQVLSLFLLVEDHRSTHWQLSDGGTSRVPLANPWFAIYQQMVSLRPKPRASLSIPPVGAEST